MSIVVIQIGQCGNQIGYNFFNTLSSYLNKKENKIVNKKFKKTNSYTTTTNTTSTKTQKNTYYEDENINKENKNINANIIKENVKKGNEYENRKPSKKIDYSKINVNYTTSTINDTDNDNKDKEWDDWKLKQKLYQRFFNLSSKPFQQKKKDYITDNIMRNNNKKEKEENINKNETNIKIKARAILIDSEIKVIKNIINKTKGKSWIYDENNIYHEQIGAANNWSFGYYMHGPKAYQTIKNRIQIEVENCIDFDGFLILQSLAGGTGSGLGSYFTEKLRQDYPYASILNLAIWPYQTGEVVIQNYNIILSIGHLYKMLYY